jgi:serine protease
MSQTVASAPTRLRRLARSGPWAAVVCAAVAALLLVLPTVSAAQAGSPDLVDQLIVRLRIADQDPITAAAVRAKATPIDPGARLADGHRDRGPAFPDPAAPSPASPGPAAPGPATPDPAAPAAPIPPPPEPLRVPTSPSTGGASDSDGSAAIAALAVRTGVALTFVRGGGNGALVARLPAAVGRDEARDIARRLMRDPAVADATPDIPLRALTNDPLNAAQWALATPMTASPSAPPTFGVDRAGIDVYPVWTTTRGRTARNEPVVVAVIDTGRTGHPDLNARWVGGWDFVSGDRNGFATANDGDGRDADPSDPGDACDAGGVGRASSWHGTSVAGIVAATADNSIGIAGAAPEASVLPIRALGRCGGRLSDALDAMLWAAGIPVPGIPDNPHPARVLNLSLGGAFDESCSMDTSISVQAAIDAIVARDVLVVAAAGNDGETAGYPATGAIGMPANCRGVVAVAAHTRAGDLASYSNFGAAVALTAPGGGCGRSAGDCTTPLSPCPVTEAPCGIVTTSNSGADAPSDPAYSEHFVGTSGAAPHAAAAAALLFAVRPTASAGDVAAALGNGARPWPDGTFCALRRRVASAAPACWTSRPRPLICARRRW